MRRMLLTLTPLVLASAAPLAAQQTGARTTPLLKQAKVTEDATRATALARVPGGKVIERELEEEGGTLIWSFDIKVEGKSGVEEVQVDAMTGAIVGQEHETPGSEAAEAAADKAKAKAKKKS